MRDIYIHAYHSIYFYLYSYTFFIYTHIHVVYIHILLLMDIDDKRVAEEESNKKEEQHRAALIRELLEEDIDDNNNEEAALLYDPNILNDLIARGDTEIEFFQKYDREKQIEEEKMWAIKCMEEGLDPCKIQYIYAVCMHLGLLLSLQC